MPLEMRTDFDEKRYNVGASAPLVEYVVAQWKHDGQVLFGTCLEPADLACLSQVSFSAHIEVEEVKLVLKESAPAVAHG